MQGWCLRWESNARDRIATTVQVENATSIPVKYGVISGLANIVLSVGRVGLRQPCRWARVALAMAITYAGMVVIIFSICPYDVIVVFSLLSGVGIPATVQAGKGDTCDGSATTSTYSGVILVIFSTRLSLLLSSFLLLLAGTGCGNRAGGQGWYLEIRNTCTGSDSDSCAGGECYLCSC